MRRLLVPAIVAAVTLAACSSPVPPAASSTAASSTPAPANPGQQIGVPNSTPQVWPACFPFHDPRAQGPGPSTWGWAVQGPNPLFPGASMRVISQHWPADAHSVKLTLLPRVENAMWYGVKADLAQCLEPHGQVLATLNVDGGYFEWSGKAPAANPGDNPTLVAVDDTGRYYLQGLGIMNDKGVNPPFRLTVGNAGAEPPAVQEAVVGEPTQITGTGLPIADGPVLISLGTGDVPLGTAQVKGGKLELSVTIPPLVTTGDGESALLLPSEYFIVITPPERPYTFYYTTTLRLLPDSRDQAILAAFWRQVEADPQVKDALKQFPRSGGPAPCRIAANADRPDGTCATQISRRDPRHDPAVPAGQPTKDLHTVTLTASSTTGIIPHTHIRTFVIDPNGRILAEAQVEH
jgi:hypothetical protein